MIPPSPLKHDIDGEWNEGEECARAPLSPLARSIVERLRPRIDNGCGAGGARCPSEWCARRSTSEAASGSSGDGSSSSSSSSTACGCHVLARKLRHLHSRGGELLGRSLAAFDSLASETDVLLACSGTPPAVASLSAAAPPRPAAAAARPAWLASLPPPAPARCAAGAAAFDPLGLRDGAIAGVHSSLLRQAPRGQPLYAAPVQLPGRGAVPLTSTVPPPLPRASSSSSSSSSCRRFPVPPQPPPPPPPAPRPHFFTHREAEPPCTQQALGQPKPLRALSAAVAAAAHAQDPAGDAMSMRGLIQPGSAAEGPSERASPAQGTPNLLWGVGGRGSLAAGSIPLEAQPAPALAACGIERQPSSSSGISSTIASSVANAFDWTDLLHSEPSAQSLRSGSSTLSSSSTTATTTSSSSGSQPRSSILGSGSGGCGTLVGAAGVRGKPCDSGCHFCGNKPHCCGEPRCYDVATCLQACCCHACHCCCSCTWGHCCAAAPCSSPDVSCRVLAHLQARVAATAVAGQQAAACAGSARGPSQHLLSRPPARPLPSPRPFTAAEQPRAHSPPPLAGERCGCGASAKVKEAAHSRAEVLAELAARTSALGVAVGWLNAGRER